MVFTSYIYSSSNYLILKILMIHVHATPVCYAFVQEKGFQRLEELFAVALSIHHFLAQLYIILELGRAFDKICKKHDGCKLLCGDRCIAELTGYGNPFLVVFIFDTVLASLRYEFNGGETGPGSYELDFGSGTAYKAVSNTSMSLDKRHRYNRGIAVCIPNVSKGIRKTNEDRRYRKRNYPTSYVTDSLQPQFSQQTRRNEQSNEVDVTSDVIWGDDQGYNRSGMMQDDNFEYQEGGGSFPSAFSQESSPSPFAADGPSQLSLNVPDMRHHSYHISLDPGLGIAVTSVAALMVVLMVFLIQRKSRELDGLDMTSDKTSMKAISHPSKKVPGRYCLGEWFTANKGADMEFMSVALTVAYLIHCRRQQQEKWRINNTECVYRCLTYGGLAIGWIHCLHIFVWTNRDKKDIYNERTGKNRGVNYRTLDALFDIVEERNYTFTFNIRSVCWECILSEQQRNSSVETAAPHTSLHEKCLEYSFVWPQKVGLGRVPLGETVHVNDKDGDVDIETPSSLQWWLDYYPLLADEDKPIECTQLPDETIYIPTGWWHCVLNLETTVAVTHNILFSFRSSLYYRTIVGEMLGDKQ
ncbi:transferase, transferring glycosyl group [Artemisia annua]|uniref:Transferase, transferring glycosyl group n=1 Tax=Artemisia annua TaxID=35608 RepID=A0A2U1L9P4_ARTAN|nr:transferase, transferring glycosyl group [Artemisia annua]